MAQSAALINLLKRVLKDHHLTYADIGKALDMSEANVKRQFASKRFSLDRLEDICRVAGMELIDLFQLFADSRQRITRLSHEQEEELVKDPKLLMVALGVRNHLTFQEILDYYQLSEPVTIRHLATLDRLKLIDLLPNNRIKLRVDEDFRWIPNGPIEQFFERQLQEPFLRSRFTGEREQRLFLHGLLGDASIELLSQRISLLAKEFNDLLRRDISLPMNRRHSLGILFAMRPIEVDMFQAFNHRVSSQRTTPSQR